MAMTEPNVSRDKGHVDNSTDAQPAFDALTATAKLLAEVFPSSRAGQVDYLRWLYNDCPFGVNIEANLDDRWGRVGHYTLIPMTLSSDGETRLGALSLNTAVHSRARGKGAFVDLATKALTLAAQKDIEIVLGVANANSTPGFVGRLGFELLGALPATVLLPLPGVTRTGFEGFWATSQAPPIQSDLLSAEHPGLARMWTPETLAWRLASPFARYAVHVGDDMVAVTTRDIRAGMAFAVILKLFVTKPVSPSSARALIRHICRWHRAPLALHIGINEYFRLTGIPLPARLRPSPLNLIHRNLRYADRTPSVSAFELLDFDAY